MPLQIYELDTGLDVKRFVKCVDSLITHYSSLRTFFLHEAFASPLQVILKSPSFPVPLDSFGATWFSVTQLDWTDADGEEEGEGMSRRMEDFLTEDRKRGFDFYERKPLMRFYLIKESKFFCIFFLTQF